MANTQADSCRGNIMIVDDTLPNLRVLGKMLIEHKYLVRGIPNGAMALTAAASEPPDLILLDIMMPEMNGYEVCTRLKADERTRDIPVIFISALDEVLDKVRAFSIGGVDYITKPFQAEEVLARVATHLSLQALRRLLENQVIALQRANAELDAFAHTVAHDLKGPLSNVIGFAELLKSMHTSMSKAELDDYLGTIVQVGFKMRDIIEALLLLAGVRKMEGLETEPLDMARIVDDVRERLTYMIEEYQAEVILPESWPVALGYGPWIEEVWTNYLSNALKYGGEPPRVELGATDQENGMVRFWIRDNGRGLAPEEQARLFTPFTRLDQVRVKGHGLGLSIVRRIAEKLGGEVGVESEKEQGSTFFFTLPGQLAEESGYL